FVHALPKNLTWLTLHNSISFGLLIGQCLNGQKKKVAICQLTTHSHCQRKNQHMNWKVICRKCVPLPTISCLTVTNLVVVACVLTTKTCKNVCLKHLALQQKKPMTNLVSC